METLIFYVYAYLREDGTPYYIGKGKPKPIVICEHCGKQGGSGAMNRWHGSNCKLAT